VGYDPARLAAACRRLKVADLSPVDAALVGYRVPLFSEVHRSPVWTNERMRERIPWKFVDQKALTKAVKSLPRLRRRAGLDPSRCASGACGWCGVPESCGWFTSKQKWPDGSPAPLCRACHEVDVRHGRPSHPDDLPAALAEAITGTPPMLGEQAPPGLVPYCESTSPDIRRGQEARTGLLGQEPWAHLPPGAVESFRWHVWGRFGGLYAPGEHRQEALDRWAAAEAVKRVQDGEKAAQEIAKADTFGFGAKVPIGTLDEGVTS
jgi:hypothetical protein